MTTATITSVPSTLITAITAWASTAGSNSNNVASRVSGQDTTRGQAGDVKQQDRDATHLV